MSRTRISDTFPLVPMFFCWTTSGAHPDGTLKPNFRPPLEKYPFQPLLSWPPTPLMVTFLLPVVRYLYRRGMSRLHHWAMGTLPGETQPVRRIELALNEGRPLNLQIAANFERHEGNVLVEGDDMGDPQDNDNPEQQGQPQDAAADAPQDPGVVAEQTIKITGSSLGRFIGGALLVPKIASVMGSLLYRLSYHSVFLRKFLAIRPPLARGGSGGWFPPLDSYSMANKNVWAQVGLGLEVGLNVLFGGTKTWAEADPVW